MRKIAGLLLMITLFASCKKKQQEPETIVPQKVVLTLPLNNAPCLTNTVDANNKSKVTLSWQAAEGVTTYKIFVKNLLTGNVESLQSAFTSVTPSLQIGMPYSWYVTAQSLSTGATLTSDTWKFYNAAQGVANYNPFPADVVAPMYAQVINSDKVSFSWKGVDIDGDIKSYSIYLGPTKTPPLFKADITNMFLNDVPVTPKSTYYWKIVTADQRGNTSETELFTFSTN